jgi:hypothetical protein
VSGGVIPSRIGAVRPLASTESIPGVVTGDDIDWDTSPVGPSISSADQWKQPVRCATTAAITIATALNVGDLIDGVTLADGDRVLVKDQAAPEDNGIYLAGATPSRAPDMDLDTEVPGAVVMIEDGTLNGSKIYACTATSPFVLDTDPMPWAVTGGGGGDVSGAFYVGWENTPFLLNPGSDVDVQAPFTGTITGWTMLADVSGTASVDVWKTTFAGYPPTVANTLIDTGAGGLKPTLSGAATASASVAHWTTAVTAGDCLRFHLESATGITRLLLVLAYSRP